MWAVAVLALLAAGAVALVRVRARRAGGDRSAAAAREAGEGVRAASPAATGAHVAELPDLLRRARGNPGLLVAAYAAWAREPDALAARRVLVGAMSALPLPAARLGALLAAAEASPLPPTSDPAEPAMVAAVSSLWRGDFLRRGRDLLFAEARPKAKEVVFASFVSLALSDTGAGLDGAQRGALTSDFIDLYGRAPVAQRPQILAVVRKLGGDDAAELLSGRGLGNSQIEAHVRYQRDLERAKAAAGK